MIIDKEKFIFSYTNTFLELDDHKKDGIRTLLTFLEEDPNIKDIRWIAYMLATVKHECAEKWWPIEEFGKGKGRKYGKPDAVTKKVYYGRGYVQLTWKENYAMMSTIVGKDLVNNPDLVLDPEISYKIMSYGMINGSFTGVGLPKYINDEKCDYINARKIINGLDCAKAIAGYAEKIETILKNSILEEI